MSLAKTQRAASAVSLSPVVNGLVLAPLHPNVNYWAQKKRVSAFYNGPSPFS